MRRTIPLQRSNLLLKRHARRRRPDAKCCGPMAPVKNAPKIADSHPSSTIDQTSAVLNLAGLGEACQIEGRIQRSGERVRLWQILLQKSPRKGCTIKTRNNRILAIGFLTRMRKIVFATISAPSGGSRQCSKTPAIEGEPDVRRTRPNRPTNVLDSRNCFHAGIDLDQCRFRFIGFYFMCHHYRWRPSREAQL
jgi:hypothetical protein